MKINSTLTFTSLAILAFLLGHPKLAAAAQPTSESAHGTVASLPEEVQKSIVKQLAKLTASQGAPGDYFGFATAFSGNTVVVGAPYTTVNGNALQGAAYVFTKPATGWADMTETATLTPSDAAADEYFGLSVAISGNTVVIEAGYGGGPSAYVFVEPAGGWTNMSQTAKLTSPTNFFGGGSPPSIATDGNTVVIGVPWAPLRGQFTGAAYVFQKPPSGWTNISAPTAQLTPELASSFFGTSVSVNGNNVVVCGLGGEMVYLFVRPKKGWNGIRTETAQLTPSDGAFVHSVAMDSNTVVAGSPSATVGSDVGRGAVYVFVEPVAGWTSMTETAKLTASDGAANDQLGFSVAINGGGSEIAAGAYGRDSDKGAAYAFVRPSTGWASGTQSAEFTASDGGSGDWLGNSVSIGGSQIVAGAPQFSISEPGVAYVFGPR